MHSEKLNRVEIIRRALVHVDADKKRAFVAEACAGDPELLAEAMALLDQGAETLRQHSARTGFPPKSGPQADAQSAGRYELLETVGSGGMGVVYKARDAETGAIVAVKVLHTHIAARSEWVDRFRTELVLARKITHKNICRSYDLTREGESVSISMEYIDGESLKALLARPQGVSFRQGLRIVRQILSGLAEAHAQGVIHRDLKPENILVARDGTVKVMDFGVARLASSATTETASIVGTPAYMSPEQAGGKGADVRSDIYSLGLVMYEIFCGQPAFKGETLADLAMQQVHEMPPPPRQVEPQLPAFMERVILKCIEKDPAKRFQSTAELETALEEQEVRAASSADTGAVLPLPVRFERWQPGDWLLLVLAAAGLMLFLPLSQRTSIAFRIAPQFEPAVLGRIAQEYAQELGAPMGGNRQIRAVSRQDSYDYVASTAGAFAALDLADNPVPYLLWRVEWDNGTVVDLTNGGQLAGFARSFAAAPIESISSEQGYELGRKAMEDFLRGDASILRLQASGESIWRGLPAMAYTWSDPASYNGLQRIYAVQIVGNEIASMESDFLVPAGYAQRTLLRQLTGYLLLPLLLLVAGLAQRRQVDLWSRWRLVVVALGAIVMGRLFWLIMERLGAPRPLMTVGFVNAAIAGGVLLFFVLAAIERAMHTIGPYKLSTTIRLFGRGGASAPCGLAILRGTLIGSILLGADAVLVWLGTRYMNMAMDATVLAGLEVYYNNAWRSVQRVLLPLGFAPVIAAYIAWAAWLAMRARRAAWLSILISAAMLAAILPVFPVVASAGFLQPYPWKAFLVLVHYAILVWTLMKFDFLTLAAAIFTFGFCGGSYLSLSALSHVGLTQEAVVFAAWALFVVAAIAVAFQTNILAAYRRLVAALQ